MKNVFTQQLDEFNFEYELNESTGMKQMYISGIGLQAGVKNRNSRIYPEPVLDSAVMNHVSTFFKLGRCCGELKHPNTNSFEIDEDRISHRFTDIKKDDLNWNLKALVLGTTTGLQLRNLIEGGIKMGFSSRCIGSVKQSEGVEIVQPGLKIVSLADAVFSNSAPDAIVDAIYEKKEWIYENGTLVERDLSENIDEYTKLIKNTPKNERSKVFAKIFTDYVKSIKLT